MRLIPREGLNCVALATATMALLAGPAPGQSSTQTVRHPTNQQTVQEPPEPAPIDYHLPFREVDLDRPAEEITPEDLLIRFADLHTATQYEQAAAVALRLVEMIPDRPLGHYNVACVMARLQRSDEALDALERAIDCGWRDQLHIDYDTDLDAIRRSERFATLMKRLESLIESERLRPRPLRTGDWRRVVEDLTGSTPLVMQQAHVPGMTIALVRDGRVVWTSSFGLNDEAANEPMRDELLFRVLAPMRLVALVAALQQEQAGRMSLAAVLAPYVEPALPPGGRPIPAGWWDRPAEERATGGWHEPSAPRGEPAVMRSRAGSPTLSTVLRESVELATRERFEEYCQVHIFDPLEMNSTGFALPDDATDHMAVGHTRLGTPVAPTTAAHGRLASAYTTVADLARMVEMMIGTSDAAPAAGLEGQVIGEMSAEEARTLTSLNLGVQVRATRFGTRVRIVDSVDGCGSLVQWYPAAGCGVVMLYNAENGRDTAERLAHLALGGE